MSDETPPTEAINPRTRDLDLLDSQGLVRTLVAENAAALEAVMAAAADIAAAVDLIVARIQSGGRLHYFGAGTSGRIAVLDAAECTPTFGVPPDFVRAHLAGGSAAFERSIEGAEDDEEAGNRAVRASVTRNDALVGISASGGAPFVVSAASAARAMGALTVALTGAPRSRLALACDVAIILDTGSEPIAGSTRMKAGTAQKLALNALSTATMVRIGKVYDNLMVDVVATNEKLRRRAALLVARLVPASAERAHELLEAADGSVKVAVVMGHRGVGIAEARTLLARAHGRLRSVLRQPGMP